MNDPLKQAVEALERMESAFDWFVGRSAFTQTRELKGLEHSARVRTEAYAAHDQVRTALTAAREHLAREAPDALARAWADLPAQLQAHPGVKALRRAALSQPQPAAVAVPTAARWGPVMIGHAVLCCEKRDREPCPHDPSKRCDTCPGHPSASWVNPAPHAEAPLCAPSVLAAAPPVAQPVAPMPVTREFCASFPGTAAGIINALARQIDAAPPARPEPLTDELIESAMNPCDESDMGRHLRREFIESFKRVYARLHGITKEG